MLGQNWNTVSRKSRPFSAKSDSSIEIVQVKLQNDFDIHNKNKEPFFIDGDIAESEF